MNFGIDRLINDLKNLGFDDISSIQDNANSKYALLSNYEIPAGTFAGKVIDLAIPAPEQYPQIFGASIHLRSEPHLVDFGSVPNLRNVIVSSLGTPWQYWSYSFKINPINPTSELITQVNEIFRKN